MMEKSNWSSMVKVFSHGIVELSMRVPGMKVRCKEKVNLSILPKRSTMESSSRIKQLVMESL